ncbi:Uncharacterised protein [Mycobacteroides abscessus subsp. abscessus]|nr:Uncharacterised protein [Mycobacteroides abscessus subsp. abscessus]
MSSRTPKHDRAANTFCHDPCTSTAAPRDGARIGAIPMTSVSREITVAAALSV